MTTAIAIAIEDAHEEAEWAAGLPAYLRNCGARYPDKAHPNSYGADLPLSSLTEAQLTKTTAAERKLFAARQVTLWGYQTDEQVAERYALEPGRKYYAWQIRDKAAEHNAAKRHRERAIKRFAELNIVPDSRDRL